MYLPGTGTLGSVVRPVAVTTHSQGIPPDFYPPHVNVGPPIPPAATTSSPPPHHVLSAPIPISAPPTLLDEYGFFKSLVVGFHTVQFSGSSGYFLLWGQL